MPLPLAVAAGLGLTTSVGGLVQIFQGASDQREAEKASTKFAADIRQRLLERTVGKQAIPMRGFDLAKEGLAQRYATGVSALQSAGAEGVLGGLGGLMQQQTGAELALAAQIEKMEYARDLDYQKRLDRERDLKYKTLTELDVMGLKGAQAKSADAYAQRQAGIQGIVGGLGTAAELGLEYSPLYRKTGADTGTGVGRTATQLGGIGAFGQSMGPTSLFPNVSPFMQQGGLSSLGGGAPITTFMQQPPSAYTGMPAYGDPLYQSLLGF